MKFAKLIFALCLFAALPAMAQQYQTYSGATALLTGTTNVIAANTLTNYPTVRIDVPRSEYVALETSFGLVAAGTAGTVLNFYKSLDGTTKELIPVHTWTCAANGTTNVVYITNLFVGGVPYLFLGATNGNNSVLTNFQVRYGFKR